MLKRCIKELQRKVQKEAKRVLKRNARELRAQESFIEIKHW
jgi:hypothetical protein